MDTPSKSSIVPGTMHFSDDGQVCYVTEDLETKLKLSSPTSSANQSFNDYFGDPNLITSSLLNKLENQSQTLSQNVGNMIQYISKYSHSVTSLTFQSVNNYEKCLVQTCETIDSNIKLMYQVMSKYEELLQEMKPIEKISDEIKKIKRILIVFGKQSELLNQ